MANLKNMPNILTEISSCLYLILNESRKNVRFVRKWLHFTTSMTFNTVTLHKFK